MNHQDPAIRQQMERILGALHRDAVGTIGATGATAGPGLVRWSTGWVSPYSSEFNATFVGQNIRVRHSGGNIAPRYTLELLPASPVFDNEPRGSIGSEDGHDVATMLREMFEHARGVAKQNQAADLSRAADDIERGI